MIRSINVPSHFKILFATISGVKYIIVSSDENFYKSYIRIPNEITILKHCSNTLTLRTDHDSINNINFIESRILEIFKSSLKVFKRSIFLKGLGLKASLLNSRLLEFKLGYSHTCLFEIPKNISNVTIIKNIITIESFDLLTLGNFLSKIRSFKKPNVYKGKGIWYKNESIILKTIKKS